MSDAESTVLPCGCIVSTGMMEGLKTFVLQACSPDCEVVKSSLELADQYDRPVDLRTNDTVGVHCPRCFKYLDGHLPVQGEAVLPDPGSVAICDGCAYPAMFDRNPDGDLYLRQPTDEEAADMARDPGLQAVIEAMTRAINNRRESK